MEREKYSIILTKLMILDIKYLEKYSCREEYATARQIVHKTNNCEDILMNFVVADEIQRGPLMVGGLNEAGLEILGTQETKTYQVEWQKWG